jgi:ATP-binding cassette, subfamily C (CFTR/MRP), member 1
MSAKETDQVPYFPDPSDQFNSFQETQKSVTFNTPPSASSRQIDESEAEPGGDAARRLGDWAVYRRYFGLAGRLPAFIFIVSGALNGFLLNFPRLWLTYWSNDVDRQEAGHPALHSKAYYNGIYGLLQVDSTASFIVAALTVLHTIFRDCGTALHRSGLQTIIQAPLAFFTSVNTGVAFNYFSQYMTLIDGELPVSMLNLVIDSFSVLGMAAILGSSAPWLVLTYPFFVWSLSMLLRFYLRTSRQLRLLDLEAKAPLYSHFLDTMRGHYHTSSVCLHA